MWRVIWTTEASPWPNCADWGTQVEARICAVRLELDGITDATIHQIGDAT